MNILNFEVQKTETNISLLKWLEGFYLSRKIINQLQSQKLVRLNGEIVDYEVLIQEYDIISIDIDSFEENTYLAYEQELKILYEDEDILVVNKPRNILIHPDGNTNETLGNIVSNYYISNNLNRSIRHVHRLDFETSGVIIYAKHFLAHAFLNNQFKNQQVKRIYLAICEGGIEPRQSVINKNIGRHRHQPNKYRVNEKGKVARTNYFALRYKRNFSLVMLLLSTGRTHQIRVHLSDAGHPIVGDELYGSKTKEELMLHSYAVEFSHPRTKEVIRVEAKTPTEFTKKWDSL